MKDIDTLGLKPPRDEAEKPQQTALDAPEALIDSAIGSVDALQTSVRAGEDHELHLRMVIRCHAKAGSHQVESGGADPPSPRGDHFAIDTNADATHDPLSPANGAIDRQSLLSYGVPGEGVGPGKPFG